MGWKIAVGLILLFQGVLTTIAFRTFDAVQELKTAKVENAVLVNSIILPTLSRHDAALERLKDENAKNRP
jgi:hypothetical protein